MTEELPPSLSELLAHRPFLERLALHLAGSRGSADDLVQDTLLEAIERPPRHGANLPAWLQRVMRNLHYRRKQRGALQKTTELDPVLPSADAPAEELAARSEISRKVAACLLVLENPYRSVLLLRYYEDLTPTQIAARLARPVNTVTSQLARGVERLRAELDRQHDGERERWVRALLPFAFPRERREEDAPPLPPAEASRDSLRRLAFGGGALLVTGAVVWLWIAPWQRQSALEAPGESVAAAPPVAPAPEADVVADQRREPIAVAPEPPAPVFVTTLPSEAPSFDVAVVDPEGEPIAGARILVTRPPAVPRDARLANYEASGDVTLWTDATRTDDHGRARFVPSKGDIVKLFGVEYVGVIVLEPSYVRSLAYYVPFPPTPAAPLRISLEGPALTVRGRVLDAQGAPAGAGVYIGDEEGGWGEKGGVRFVRRNMGVPNDVRGDFVYEGLAPGQNRVVIRGQGFVPLDDSIAAPAGTLERTFVLDRGGSVKGWAVTKDGEPVPGAEIWAEYMLPRMRPMFVRYYTHEDATFDFHGMPPGLVRMLALHPRDPELTDSVFLTFVKNEEKEWMPELDRRPPVVVKIVTDEDRPVAGAGIRIINERANQWWRNYGADDEGVLSIPDLPPANYLVDVFRSVQELGRGGLPLATMRKVVVGENTLVIPRSDLEGGALKGRIVASPEQLQKNPLIYVRPMSGRASAPTTVDAETGIYSREPITPRPYEVTLFMQRLGVAPLGKKKIRANETLDLGDFVVPEVGTIEVDWRWKGAEGEYSYQLLALESTQIQPDPIPWPIYAGQGPPAGPLPVLPGRFRWTVSREGKAVETRVLDVQSGSTFDLVTGVEER